MDGNNDLKVIGSGLESFENVSGVPSEFRLSSSSEESSLLLELENRFNVNNLGLLLVYVK